MKAISSFTMRETLKPFRGPTVHIPELQLRITNNFKTTGSLSFEAIECEQRLNNALKARAKNPELDTTNKLVYDESYGGPVIMGRCASKAFRFDTTSSLQLVKVPRDMERFI